jgi:hypothetical protein
MRSGKIEGLQARMARGHARFVVTALAVSDYQQYLSGRLLGAKANRRITWLLKKITPFYKQQLLLQSNFSCKTWQPAFVG